MEETGKYLEKYNINVTAVQEKRWENREKLHKTNTRSFIVEKRKGVGIDYVFILRRIW